MPRRPPARVRAQQRRYASPSADRPLPRIPGASSALQGAIARLETDDSRFHPGDVASAFRVWQRVTGGPARRAQDHAVHADCELCNPPSRDVLELALHLLPRRSAQELRHLVAPLDERFLRLTIPLPSKPPGPWWARRT
ncbi:hypothetical protein [Glycomyces tritici]|uniref:DUF721 domain-containing protein n=1 Tax=Glycomyces tritici TaxID=2665176 RepID=A0ABT7YXI9_9ACTN|nr:hypothetical protein [Glycomyces tritici]MDN3241323.1 hypothetical protein [Glycomyces tritici]MDN3243346.1 hypothetical protein [Glycomyces tritici]